DANDTTGYAARSTVGFHLRAQRARLNMKPLIGGNLAQAFPAKTENVRALLDRIMTLFRGVNHEIAGNRPHARTDYLRVSIVARAFQRDQICLRPTTRQRAETLWSVADQLTEP